MGQNFLDQILDGFMLSKKCVIWNCTTKKCVKPLSQQQSVFFLLWHIFALLVLYIANWHFLQFVHQKTHYNLKLGYLVPCFLPACNNRVGCILLWSLIDKRQCWYLSIFFIIHLIWKVPRQSWNGRLPDRLRSCLTKDKAYRQPEKCRDKPIIFKHNRMCADRKEMLNKSRQFCRYPQWSESCQHIEKLFRQSENFQTVCKVFKQSWKF